jgi:hypothetical protein
MKAWAFNGLGDTKNARIAAGIFFSLVTSSRFKLETF